MTSHNDNQRHPLRRRFKALLVVPGLLFATVVDDVQAQQTKKGPSAQQLQERIIELQSQLLSCQKASQDSLKAAQEAATNPLKEAREALQGFNSAVDAGVNWAAYRDALIPLKVKIDRLPEGEDITGLKRVLEIFVDAGRLWNMSIADTERIGSGAASLRGVRTTSVTPFQEKYGDIWQPISQASGKYGTTFRDYTVSDYVKLFSSALIAKGQKESQAILHAK